MKHYTHFSEKERESIYFYLLAGKKKKEIALLLRKHPSSIGRELKRNSCLVDMTRISTTKTHYLPNKAHRKYMERKSKVGKMGTVLKGGEIRDKVVNYITLGYAPPLISGIMKKEGYRISHEAIYQFIYHNDYKHLKLWEYLPMRRKKRKKQNGRSIKKTKIPNRISITHRPPEVATRATFGHRESDSIEGLRGCGVCLHVSTERKTRKIKIRKIPQKTAKYTNLAMKSIFGDVPKEALLTITSDNGTEFSGREVVHDAVGIDFYFTHPYSSWEKGTVERMNGFIRRFFPKKTDFTTITDEEIQFVEDWINNRPMEVLNFDSPNQAFANELSLISI